MTKLEHEIYLSGAPLRREGSECLKDFIFEPCFIGFTGHFPNLPVLPALVQLMAGSLCASEATGQDLVPTGINRAKFFKPISPNQAVCVRLSLSQEQHTWRAAVRLESQGETVSTFQLILVVKES
jgi:3-hydroxyacyl-[acyl-carrier-protein] dehydratase